MPERCASQSFELPIVSLLGSLLLMGLVELCRVFQKRKLKTGIRSEQLLSDRSLYCVQHKLLFPAVLCGFLSFPSLTAQQIHTPIPPLTHPCCFLFLFTTSSLLFLFTFYFLYASQQFNDHPFCISNSQFK